MNNNVEAWTAECIGGIFPTSRLREIKDARDVLTPAEKRVYELFWQCSIPRDASDQERLVSIGYDMTSRATEITKRNIAHVISRLIRKGFLELIAPPETYGRRLPATYRVISCAAVREDQRRKGRDWLIRSGRGVHYAARYK